MRTYELVFVAQPELDEDALTALTESIQQVMVDNGGEIVEVRPMGRRRLAYPIKRVQEGQYVLVHAALTSPAIAEIERTLKLSDDVLRHLLVRVEDRPDPEPEATTEEDS